MMTISVQDNGGMTVDEWMNLAETFRDDGCEVPLHFYVTGVSMLPLLRSGKDKVTIISRKEPLKCGDIVLFRGVSSHAKYVLHRVYKIKRDRVLTYGDGNRYPDYWMPLSNILGVVIQIERGAMIIKPQKGYWRLVGNMWMFMHPLRPFLMLVLRLISRLRSEKL